MNARAERVIKDAFQVEERVIDACERHRDEVKATN